MKLLVVDDQLITLNGVARMIDWAAEGFDVVDTAQNAMEARLSFSRGVPDVMLCDIEMPVENGVELCKWVRQQGYSTGIIFLTYITRVFKKETGYSIKSYIIREKMLMARQLLQTTSLSVGSVAMQLGYNNFSHFSAAYKKEFGISPGEEIRPET